ncbi:hypothetical protein Btru_012265 [Bulinus truncatus]|nr:hypothetical protein Btru_012265 [Bulinus truncatus]
MKLLRIYIGILIHPLGQHGTYSGGGYVVNISREDFNLAMQSLEKVQESDWLDQHTRCIILEFTAYNPSSDLFTNVILAFEFDVTGGIFPYYSISAARFYLDSARKDDWLQIAEGITGICVAFYTVLEIYIMIEKGLTNYLKNFWNLLEIAVLSLSYVVGVLYLLRLMAYMDAINTFNTYGHARFIDFQTVFYRNFLFNTSMGVLGALAIFKMLKVITFNPFMVTYTKTMETISSGFIAFSGVSAIYLLAFSMSGLVLFGPYIFGYVTIDRALFSLLFFILGEADYENLISANGILGPAFFLIVLIVTQYIIINFFVAILREGLELARTSIVIIGPVLFLHHHPFAMVIGHEDLNTGFRKSQEHKVALHHGSPNCHPHVAGNRRECCSQNTVANKDKCSALLFDLMQNLTIDFLKKSQIFQYSIYLLIQLRLA